MTIRRWATLSLLLFFNVIFGVYYMQPFKTKMLVSYSTNDTEVFTESTLMTSFTNKSNSNATEEPLKKSSTQAYMPEITFPVNFNFTLNPFDFCSKETSGKSKLSLLVLVCTAVPNFKQRRAIRETWGSFATAENNSGNVRLAFLLGATNNLDIQQRVEEEFALYGDVIQQDFVDSYRNLTLKSVMLLKWVNEFCPNVQYVMKTDDDMYVNVANLVSMLVRLPVKSNVMYGVLFKKAKPNRNPSSKWYVPKNQYEENMFPDYLSGTGYVMSRDVVPKLLEASAVLPFMVMEDVFITGLCASESRVKRYNVRGFAYWRRSATGCAFKDVITGHHVPITDMYKIWKELNKTPLVCSKSKKKL